MEDPWDRTALTPMLKASSTMYWALASGWIRMGVDVKHHMSSRKTFSAESDHSNRSLGEVSGAAREL